MSNIPSWPPSLPLVQPRRRWIAVRRRNGFILPEQPRYFPFCIHPFPSLSSREFLISLFFFSSPRAIEGHATIFISFSSFNAGCLIPLFFFSSFYCVGCFSVQITPCYCDRPVFFLLFFSPSSRLIFLSGDFFSPIPALGSLRKADSSPKPVFIFFPSIVFTSRRGRSRQGFYRIVFPVLCARFKLLLSLSFIPFFLFMIHAG